MISEDARSSFSVGSDLTELALATEFDLDSSVLYLDLQQVERGRQRTSLLMHALFPSVFEWVKTVDQEVVFVIDEAHYLLREQATASALETAVRHSPHYDLSLHFVTQTSREDSDTGYG